VALVARMVATEVIERRGVQRLACPATAEGARPTTEVYGNYHYGVPVWLEDAEYVRDVEGKGSETIKLEVIRSKGPDDPSNQWFEASPHGMFEMTLQNPNGFGYVQAGAEYRVTIERIRGPRSAERQALADAAEQDARS
jgi:hypothetical protein